MSDWVLHVLARPQARRRLFCLPYAGGGASVFREWPAALPASIEVCPVQLPGRENRIGERPVTDMTELSPALVRALRPHLGVPYALFGHSMGALIAFELARELRRQHLPSPVHLFVSGRGAPQRPRLRRPSPELGADELRARLRSMGGSPAAMLENPELMELVLPTLRADLALCDTYAPAVEDPLECPITAFGGAQDRGAGKALRTWRRHTRGPFRTRMFRGGHFFLQRARPTLLGVIAECLAE